jgi:hypothetical protein
MREQQRREREEGLVAVFAFLLVSAVAVELREYCYSMENY